MALIGSAMGNIIIFRTHSSYDRFTEETLQKLSLGAQEIGRNINDIQNLFGGTLIFCPRDVNDDNKIQLRDEFRSKIKNSVDKWAQTNNRNIKSKIFGLFDDYVIATTPIYKAQSFYNVLRNQFINDFLGDTLKFQRHPIYQTGIEFFQYLKYFLYFTSTGDFDFLSNRKERDIGNYININKKKAYELIGNYNHDEEDSLNNYFSEFNGLKIYYNKDYLNNLIIDITNNKYYEPDNILIINNLQNFETIQLGEYNLDGYNIIIKINNNNNIFSMTITNLPDFGLILMIPEKLQNNIQNNINNNITYNIICNDLFKLWKDICQKIKFEDKQKIITNFKLFIKALVDRRYKNVKTWLEQITEKYENLKIYRQDDSSLESKWIMCGLNCKNCYYECYQRFDHGGSEHDCSYGHICEKEFSFCKDNFTCKNQSCSKKCLLKSGHEGIHTCSQKNDSSTSGINNNNNNNHHGHQCKGECEYYQYSKENDCNKKCNIDYPHVGRICNCEKGTPHHCKSPCDYKGARNCKKECSLEYPHKNKEKNHDCGAAHLCPIDCPLKDNPKVGGCGRSCYKPYKHEEKEGDNHKHECGKIHHCLEKCFKNCNQLCILNYNDHGTKHDCGGSNHKCGKPCPFITSKNCEKICDLPYEHPDSTCMCKLKTEDSHACDKKCSCQRDCNQKRGHQEGKCGCGNCNCREKCFYNNCIQTCSHKAGVHKEHKCSAQNHRCKEKCPYIDNSKGCNKECNIILEDNPDHTINSVHNCGKTHICKDGTCYLKDYAISCSESCSLEVDINGHHINNSSRHLCKKKNEHHCKADCYLYNNSNTKSCSKNCKVILNETNYQNHRHECTKDIGSHTCKKYCKLYKLGINNEHEECRRECKLPPGHEGECNCNGNHVCHSNCQYHGISRGCGQFCTKPLGHSLPHNCRLTKEQHNCNNKCPYCEEKCTCYYQHPDK